MSLVYLASSSRLDLCTTSAVRSKHSLGSSVIFMTHRCLQFQPLVNNDNKVSSFFFLVHLIGTFEAQKDILNFFKNRRPKYSQLLLRIQIFSSWGPHFSGSGWDGGDLPELKAEEQLQDCLQNVYALHFLSKAGDL